MQTETEHAPRFSLFGLFGIVAAASGCLALTNLHFAVSIPFLFAYVLLLAGSAVDSTLKRGLIWGVVLGALAFVLTAEVVSGITDSRMTSHAVMDFARRYAIPVGGFLGGTIGYLYATRAHVTNMQRL